MAWEKRRNGRLYFYRTHREGGRVVKEYVGSGERGRQAAAADAVARQARAESARLRRERQRPIDKIAADLDEFSQLLTRVVTGHLLSAGWKQHHRQWREPSCRNRK